MTSASDPEEQKKKAKPGPEPERLVIAPDDAEAGIDALLGSPKPKKGETEKDSK